MKARPVCPRKTALGVEEMRRRSHGLSQRHRTMLLLVDGLRSRGEVLALARQAGVEPSCFEELVGMGLIEMAPENPPPAAPVPLIVEPAVLKVTAEAPARPASSRPPADVPALPLGDALPLAATRPPAQASSPAGVTAPADAKPPEAPARGPRASRTAARKPEAAVSGRRPGRPAAESPPPRGRAAAGTRRAPAPELTPAQRPTGRRGRPSMTPSAGPLEDAAETQLIEDVRRLMLECLDLDSPLLPSLLSLRVRKARSRDELAELVWEMERRLSRARRARPRTPRAQLVQVRDLLGLGNTVVDEGPTPGAPDTMGPAEADL